MKTQLEVRRILDQLNTMATQPDWQEDVVNERTALSVIANHGGTKKTICVTSVFGSERATRERQSNNMLIALLRNQLPNILDDLDALEAYEKIQPKRDQLPRTAPPKPKPNGEIKQPSKFPCVIEENGQFYVCHEPDIVDGPYSDRAAAQADLDGYEQT